MGLTLGHEKSEEMGMEFLVEWLSDIVGETAVHFVDSGEPFSYIQY